MVYNGKPYQKGWFGGTPIFLETPILYILYTQTANMGSAYQTWKFPRVARIRPGRVATVAGAFGDLRGWGLQMSEVKFRWNRDFFRSSDMFCWKTGKHAENVIYNYIFITYLVWIDVVDNLDFFCNYWIPHLFSRFCKDHLLDHNRLKPPDCKGGSGTWGKSGLINSRSYMRRWLSQC